MHMVVSYERKRSNSDLWKTAEGESMRICFKGELWYKLMETIE